MPRRTTRRPDRDHANTGDRPEHDSISTAPTSPNDNHGSFSDAARGLVAPSRLNQGDTGVASDKPEAGGQLNFDDDEIYSGRGNTARRGGTNAAQGADSAPLGPPAEILSASNQPSDLQGLEDDAETDIGSDAGSDEDIRKERRAD